MDKTAVLRAIESWPVADRVAFLQEAWDRVVDAGWQPELTPELQAELDRRVEAADANPHDIVNWEAIVEHVRRKR